MSNFTTKEDKKLIAFKQHVKYILSTQSADPAEKIIAILIEELVKKGVSKAAAEKIIKEVMKK